ncbi:MAG: hypothetical protein L0Y71_09275 [Gemmataceae bacterium]|nr:hypothetical protein [Gemmataceae bacterium]
MRRTLRGFWPAFLFLAAGCGDSIQAVTRDYCNVQHEALDDMMQIVDEESAKRFNEDYENRIMPQEDAVDARHAKIMNNLFTEADKKITALAIVELETVTLKGQFESLDTRCALTLNRLRRLAVKMVEDKAEEAKRANQSFTVRSNDLCPELTTKLRRGKHFAKGESGGGGGMAPMMPGPGGAQMPGIGPMPGPALGWPPQPRRGNSMLSRNLEFVMECRRTEDPQNPWHVTRSWRGVQELTLNGINLAPLFSTQ